MFFKRSKYKIPDLHSDASAIRETQNARHSLFASGCVISDAGTVRFQNEDNFLLLDQINEKCDKCCKTTVMEKEKEKAWLLAGVFDGISSTEKAEIASWKAAAAFSKAGGLLQSESSDDQAVCLLRSVFWDINEEIAKARQGGTTATVLCTNRQFFKIFHLGDSRAYLFRNGQLHQLTRDQTLAQLKLDAGLYNTFSTEIHKEGHILTDYIGRKQGGYPVESDWLPIQSGDRILLCSDGLYELCSDTQMEHILQSNISIEEQTEQMVAIAKGKGGVDNITCMVIRFQYCERA